MSPAFLCHKHTEDLQRTAEAKRLLYVATTRARDRLVLVAGSPQKGKRTWINALSAWGYEMDGDFPARAALAHGMVLHHRIEQTRSGPEAMIAEKPDVRVLSAAHAFEEASRKASARRGRRILSPSSFHGERLEVDASGEVTKDRCREGTGDRAVALAVGTAVHLLLELWDRKDPSWLVANAEKAARVTTGYAEVDRGEVVARILEILESALHGGQLARIAKENALACELPVLYCDENGDVVNGTIDLLSGIPEAPTIVDYKTDGGLSQEELEQKYGGQLARYAEAVRRALGLSDPPPARIEPLGEAITIH